MKLHSDDINNSKWPKIHILCFLTKKYILNGVFVSKCFVGSITYSKDIFGDLYNEVSLLIDFHI